MDIFATTERLPEFSPVAAEGQLDEANTIFVGAPGLWSCSVADFALWQLPIFKQHRYPSCLGAHAATLL